MPNPVFLNLNDFEASDLGDRKKRLLIADDDLKVHDGLSRAFRTKRPSWRPQFVDNGYAALKSLEEQRFEVLVTDMDMPKMGGVALMETAETKYSEVARIAMSGRYDSLTTYSMTSCSHFFIPKPFTIEALVEIIEAAESEHRNKLKENRIWGVWRDK